MGDAAIKDHFTSFYTTDNPLAAAQRTEAALTFALNLVPTGGALDNLIQGNYTEAGVSAAADSLLLAGGIVKALSASRASLTAAQAARLNAAAQAIVRAETGLDLAVGGYRAGQSFHNLTNKDGSKAEGAGQAGEALLRILSGALAAKGKRASKPALYQTSTIGNRSPSVTSPLHSATTTTPPARPRAYSTAIEVQLKSKDLGRSRSVHFNRCNEAAEVLMNSDRHLAAQLEELIPGIRDAVSRKGGRRTPTDWIWEHASTSVAGKREGVMRLVPKDQHTPGSPFWRILHPDPGAAGGYSEWAIPRGAPKNK